MQPMYPGKMKLTTQGDRGVAIERAFDAPRDLVFAAFTQPDLVKRWLGVHHGWTLEVCEIELRVGGKYRYVWRGPGGEEMGMGGVHREVVVPERIVATQLFDQDWTGGEAVGTVVFSEEDGKTTVHQTILYASPEIRAAVLKTPMEQGMAAGYEVLDNLLADLRGAA